MEEALSSIDSHGACTCWGRVGDLVSCSLQGCRFHSHLDRGCTLNVQRERERDLREETVYCSPAGDCGKGSLV